MGIILQIWSDSNIVTCRNIARKRAMRDSWRARLGRYRSLLDSRQGAGRASVSSVPTMLANLMADRFSLATHTETRESQTFDLVPADDTRRLGPALRPTSTECSTMVATGASAPAAPAPVDQALCGVLQTAAGIARASGVRLTRLAQILSQLTGRPVKRYHRIRWSLRLHTEIQHQPECGRERRLQQRPASLHRSAGTTRAPAFQPSENRAGGRHRPARKADRRLSQRFPTHRRSA
jgi:hypothetical protein